MRTMGRIETVPQLNDWQREHTALLLHGFSFVRRHHQEYAREIYQEVEKRKGHSWYDMRSFAALCSYNASCVKDLELIQHDYVDAVTLAVVGSVQYGVAIPGISDIDGVILYSPDASENDVSSVRSRTREICDTYGYTDNLSEYWFDPDKYRTPQMLYWPVFTLASQGGELANRQEQKIVSYMRTLTKMHGEFPDENGWASEIEAYTRYFFSKTKQPAHYAMRLINCIGLRNFSDAGDWKIYREELRSRHPLKPLDEEELAQMEQFEQEGYRENDHYVL